MILDHKFSGILDQGKGHLIVYESSKVSRVLFFLLDILSFICISSSIPQEDVNFTRGLEIIANMSNSVEALSLRAKRLGSAGPPASSADAISTKAKEQSSDASPKKAAEK